SLRRRVAADNAEQVRARRLFLDSGHLAFVRDAIIEAIPTQASVLDVGCGVGYFTQPLGNRDEWVGGIDVSRPAVRAAARRGGGVEYAVADAFDLPVFSNSIDTALSVFGPIVPPEIDRVLTTDGLVVAASAGPRHLMELKEFLFDVVRLHPERGPLGLESQFRLESRRRLTAALLIKQPELSALAIMTPYGRRAAPPRVAMLGDVSAMTITIDVLLSVY